MTNVPPPPDPRDEPYYDPRRRDDRDAAMAVTAGSWWPSG